SNDIAQQLEVMAAALNTNAPTSSPDATITGNDLSDQFGKLMEPAADILLRPSFPNDELARYKDRTRAALIQQRANPNFVAAEVFAGALYRTAPCARPSPTHRALH